MLARAKRQDIGDVPSRVGAAGMDDARARVAAFERETVVEPHAELAEPGDPPGRFGRQELDRARPADATTRRERVRGVESGIVAFADRGGNAALRRIAVRRGVGGLREDCDRRAFVGCGEGGGEAGDPGSDDRDVDLVAFLPHKR